MSEDHVTEKFCDERTKRICAETRNMVMEACAPLKTDMRSLTSKMDNFAKEIAKHAVNASNGKVEIKPPLRERVLLYSSVVATIILVTREILSFLGGLP